MSQRYEDLPQLFTVRCSDVGLDCNCVVLGDSEEKAFDKTISHMDEYHAINPEEMTSEMKVKIEERVYQSRAQRVVQTVH